MNGDLTGDIIIGAPWSSLSHTEAGSVFIVYGVKDFDQLSHVYIANLTSALGFIILGSEDYERIGFSVAVADLNNDAVADMIVGAATADPMGRTDAGAIHVLYGKYGSRDNIDVNEINSTAGNGWHIFGGQEGDQLGYSLAIGGMSW